MQLKMFSEASSRSSCHLCFLLVALGILAHEADGQGCTNVVPGVDKMALGIDVTTFDFDDKNQNGLRRAIVQFTCKNNKKKTIDGTIYDVPDQVDSVTTLRKGLVDLEIKVTRTYNEARENIAGSFGVGGFIGKLGFSASAALTSMQHTIFKDYRYIERVSAFESARQVQLQTAYNLEIRPDLTSKLVNSESKPFRSYQDFIDTYGTHFFSTAKLGGKLLVELHTKSDYYRVHGEVGVRAQAGISYLKLLGVSGGIERNNAKVDEKFEKATVKNAKYYGGSANLLDPNGFKAWQPTVPSNPWLFAGELKPIYSLIKDNTTQQRMERAVTHRVLKAHLDELTRLLSSRRAEWSNGLDKLQEFQREVDSFKPNIWLADEESDVKLLSTKVLAQISFPREFVDRLSWCYSWYNDGNGQCSGPTSRVCASPSMMLHEHQDQVICPFAGSLKLRNHDDWFGKLQLCFRWSQCSKGDTETSCMSINQLTTSSSPYLLHMGELCQSVSWKINITDTMPVWQQNSQLCFVWRPDKGDQCGGELCAQPGRWTDYDSKMKLLQRCSSASSRGSSTVRDPFPKLGPLVLILCVLFHASRD